MRTSRRTWSIAVAAATMVWAAGGIACAQYADLPSDPAYAWATGAGPESRFAAASGEAEKDLAARVKDLESALKKIKDKEAADKKKAASAPSVKLGGRVYFDSITFGQNAVSRANLGDAQDTSFFRTARLSAEGEGFDVMYYKVEVDFAPRRDITTSVASGHSHTVSAQQTSFKDVYFGIKELPLVGKVQVGHFKEPFSLEELTSSRFITFTERALPNVLVPQRNLGIMIGNHTASENATWAMGAFRTVDDMPPYLADDASIYAFTARGTWLPWYDEATEGRGLLHVGGAYSYRDYSNNTLRLSARPETGAGPLIIDSRIGGVDTLTGVADTQLYGAELAAVYGPFSIQTEYIACLFERTATNQDPYVHGAYVYLSYFLTGEHRPYKRSSGTFDRVKPFTNFFRVRTSDGSVETGSGAIELAYRYSYLNADNSILLGGYASDHTFGVNWYLNPYTRVMCDYTHANVDVKGGGPNTYIDCFTIRAAFDF